MNFAGLDPRFVLSGVTVTDREAGRGSYAVVLEVQHNGQKYAGKQLHKELRGTDDVGTLAARFEEECRLLSQLHHPNIVQFVGIYIQQGERFPILVMEFLPTNLHACIEQYGALPREISYSVLHDVVLSLHYLHSQNPPIMHRDITAYNILLNSKMTAKICDFGSARCLVPNSGSGLTQCPGIHIYMPPEAMFSDPKYNTSIDIFSYGVVMIFMFSGKLPAEILTPTFAGSDGRLYARSEVDRRAKYLEPIGIDHPAMKLILKCIANDPQQRPTAIDISHQIKRICQYDGE